MQRVFLDTCVWIDYLWQREGDRPAKAGNDFASRIFSIIEENPEIEVIFTVFLISEISDHLRDWYILKKVLANGYSYREFGRYKKQFKLSDEEMEEINTKILSISEAKDNVNTIATEPISVSEIEKILAFDAKLGIGFYDALHIHTANKSKCDVFVTKDEELRKAITKLHQEGEIVLPCAPPKTFITQIEKVFNRG